MVVVQPQVILFMSVKGFHVTDGNGGVIRKQPIAVVIEYGLLQRIAEFFYGLRDDECPSAHAVELPDVVGAQPRICAADELCVRQHVQDFLFQGDGSQLLTGAARVKAHGDGDPLAVHEQAHFHDGVWAVFLASAILTETFHNLAGDLIHDIFIFLFTFKVKICAVIIKNRSIPFRNGIALPIKPRQIVVVVFLQQVHKAQDVLVIETGFFIVGIQLVPYGILGKGIENPGVSEETVNGVAVKGDPPPIRLFAEKILKPEFS